MQMCPDCDRVYDESEYTSIISKFLREQDMKPFKIKYCLVQF